MHRITWFILLLNVGIGFYASLVGAAGSHPVAAKAEERFLSSTIQLALILVEQNHSDNYRNEADSWRGLGTPVRHGASRFILTHGHRPIPSPYLKRGRAEQESRRAAPAVRCRYIPLHGKVSRLWNHDSAGAEQLSGVVPVVLGNRSEVAAGDTVWLAAYEPFATNSTLPVRSPPLHKAGQANPTLVPGSFVVAPAIS